MSQFIDLKQAEQRAFAATHNDGLWDILLGCFVLLFALAPLLSESLGDFWSSMVFLPFWGLVALAIWLLRRHVVAPRLGRVRFRPERQARMRRLQRVLLTVNVVALVLGILVAFGADSLAGWGLPIVLGFFALIAFSLAGLLLGLQRLYLYGLLVGFAPLAGNWLWVTRGAAHHGFPVAFGIVAAVMILTGLFLFANLLREHPLVAEEL